MVTLPPLINPWVYRCLHNAQMADEEEFEVKSILEEKQLRGRAYYKVLWADGDQTWEPEEHLKGAQELLQEFLAKQGKRAAAPSGTSPPQKRAKTQASPKPPPRKRAKASAKKQKTMAASTGGEQGTEELFTPVFVTNVDLGNRLSQVHSIREAVSILRQTASLLETLDKEGALLATVNHDAIILSTDNEQVATKYGFYRYGTAKYKKDAPQQAKLVETPSPTLAAQAVVAAAPQHVQQAIAAQQRQHAVPMEEEGPLIAKREHVHKKPSRQCYGCIADKQEQHAHGRMPPSRLLRRGKRIESVLEMHHGSLLREIARVRKALGAGDPDKISAEAASLIRLHGAKSALNEEVLYPALEKTEEGKQLAQKLRTAYNNEKTELNDLSYLDVGDASFPSRLSTAMNALEQRLREELEAVSRVVQSSQGAIDSEQLGTTYAAAHPRVSKIVDALYCVCRQTDDGRVMVQCEGCKEWFHPECVKEANEALQRGEDAEFECPRCKGQPMQLEPIPSAQELAKEALGECGHEGARQPEAAADSAKAAMMAQAKNA